MRAVRLPGRLLQFLGKRAARHRRSRGDERRRERDRAFGPDIPPAVDSAFTSFATPPDPATVLANAKGAQSAQLQAAYQAAILAPVSFTTAAGVTANFAQDATAKANLQDALAGSEKSSAWALNLWLDVNGATVTPFTYGDLQGLAAAMEAYDVPKYSELLALLAQVNSATTPAAVNAVVWS